MGKTKTHGFIILSLIAVLTVVSACGGGNTASNDTAAVNASNTNANATKANGNAEELGMIVNFTIEPDDLVWKVDDTKGSLTAVFRLDPEATKKLAEQIASGKNGTPNEVTTEDWFPPELIAQADTGAGSIVKGTAFPAAMFYQEPYSKGTVTRVEGTDWFVLELQSK